MNDEIVFTGNGRTFSAWHQAEDAMAAMGFSYGLPSGFDPIAVVHGEHTVPRWAVLNSELWERLMDAQITGDPCMGPLTLRLKTSATDRAKRAFRRLTPEPASA